MDKSHYARIVTNAQKSCYSHVGVFLQLGPNVTIGKNVVIGPGVRVRESLVLEDALIQVSGHMS